LNEKLNIVSLFDGISCGRVAIERAGIVVGSYAAFEVDKHAKAISRYNYPDISQYGDVFNADFNLFAGYDLVMGGSPCTFWSIAKTNREVERSGVGWKLFMQFVEAVRIIRPRFFFYENVASMPQNIKNYISDELNVAPILINSALVSTQSRKRLYWTNIKSINQPADRQQMLYEILDTGNTAGKIYDCDKAHIYIERNQMHVRQMNQKKRNVFEQASLTDDESIEYSKNNRTSNALLSPIRVGFFAGGGQGNRIYSTHGKSVALMANGGGRGGKVGLYKVDMPDRTYIIRRLTPIEAERCQTLPDNYTEYGIDDNGKQIKISDTQRYKCIGNGWTVDVIAHILRNIGKGGKENF